MTDIPVNTASQLGPMLAGDRYFQRFVADEEYLQGISLLVAKYGKPIRARIRLSLYDDARTTVLRSVERDTGDIPDNTWQRFLFERIVGSRGTAYWILVESDATDPEQAPTLWTNDTVPDVCSKNDRDTGAAICFMSLYLYDRVAIRTRDTTVPVIPGQSLRQRFVARSAYLDGVSFWIHHPGGAPVSTVRLAILDDPYGDIVRESVVRTDRLRNDRWHEFRFEPIPDSRQRVFWLDIECDAADPGDAISLWGNSSLRDHCLLDGAEVASALCFKTHFGRKSTGKSSLEYRCVACSKPAQFQNAGDTLQCPECHRAFAMLEHEIPVFLAEALDERNTYGELFSTDAGDYHENYGVDPQVGNVLLRRIAKLVPGMERQTSARILEIGAGAGHLTRALAEGSVLPYGKLYISDLSSEMLTLNFRSRSAVERQRGTQYFVANVLDLPFPDSALDMIIGLDVLHHVLNYPAGLREIARVLKPDGVCALLEPTREPYLLLAFVIRLLLRMEGLLAADRQLLEGYLECFFMLLAHDEAGDHDAVAHVDDKYYFDKDRLRAFALDAGFGDLTEADILRDPAAREADNGGRFSRFFFDFFTAVGVSEEGMGLVEGICADVDQTVGPQFMRDYPPNSMFFFWKAAGARRPD